MADDLRPIIKKIKKVEGEAHGSSAWKVAYADFVTAMMAFFLLLWLLNVTTDEQKHGIADYFAPSVASISESGSGDILAGTSAADQGARSSGAPTVILELETPEAAIAASADEKTEQESRESQMAELEEESFEDAMENLKRSLAELPELAELMDNLLVQLTPDGLLIQLIDVEGKALFKSGSAELNETMQDLLEQVAFVASELPNKIVISGHTDAIEFRSSSGYSNWELSADRANSSRRILAAAGIPEARISSVQGRASAELLYPENPAFAGNRRITVLLKRRAPVLPPKYQKR